MQKDVNCRFDFLLETSSHLKICPDINSKTHYLNQSKENLQRELFCHVPQLVVEDLKSPLLGSICPLTVDSNVSLVLKMTRYRQRLLGVTDVGH